MTTTQFVWERFPAYFRGIDRVLAEINRKNRIERRIAQKRNSSSRYEQDNVDGRVPQPTTIRHRLRSIADDLP